MVYGYSKREIIELAIEELINGETDFICNAVKYVIQDITGNMIIAREQFLLEHFPELSSLIKKKGEELSDYYRWGHAWEFPIEFSSYKTQSIRITFLKDYLEEMIKNE